MRAGHIVEEGKRGCHDLLLVGECGGGEFQGVEASLGGRDEAAQAVEGLEAIVAEGSLARREGHIDRERNVGDGLDGVVDRGTDVGFDASSVAQQGEVIAVDDQRRTGGYQNAALRIGVGRAERVVEGGEGRRLLRTGGRRHGLGRDTRGAYQGAYQQDQGGPDPVSERHDRLSPDGSPITAPDPSDPAAGSTRERRTCRKPGDFAVSRETGARSDPASAAVLRTRSRGRALAAAGTAAR